MRVPTKAVPVVALLLCLAPPANSQQVSTGKEFVPSNRLNDRLPPWLQFSGEFRARMEVVSASDFRSGGGIAYLLSRLRIYMTVQPTAWLKLQFQSQDARAFWKNQQPPAPPFQETMDLRIAYLEVGDSEKKTLGLRIGRQELLLGDQRLVGNANWLNVPRVFDAVRLTVRRNGYRIDGFATTVVQPVNGEFDRPFRHKSANFHGLYGGLEKLVPNAVVEPYVLWRVTRNLLTEFSQSGNRDFKTVGVRWTGRLPASADYQVEMAVQRGTLGTDRVAAWAGHWLLGNSLGPAPHKTRLTAEYNFASGDRNPHDGVEGTFDQLYPSAHSLYGLADQVGWRNIHHVRAGTEFHPRTPWMIAASHHSYWLASASDALYAANGVPTVRRADGSAGRSVGQEADVSLTCDWSRQLQFGGGFAHLFPSTFLRSTTSGRGYNYPYLMMTYAF